jgi:hypothetical protein
MKKILLLSFLFASFFSFGQVMFQKTYGTNNGIGVNYVHSTLDSGYIICGHSGSGATLIKLDSLGNTLWTKGYTTVSAGLYIPIVDLTDDGGFIMGAYYSNGPSPAIIKLDSLGNAQWTSYFPPPAEFAYDPYVIKKNDGSYVLMCNRSDLGATWSVLINLDANGNWLSSFGFDHHSVSTYGNTQAYSIIPTSSGGVAICGCTDCGNTSSKIFIRGQSFIKTYQLSGNQDVGNSIIQDSNGNYVVCGKSNGNFLVFKVNSSGNLMWSKTYGIGNARSLKETVDGGLIIAGNISTVDSNDVYLIKTDANGNLIWVRNYGGGGNDYAYSVALALDGGFIIGGATSSFGTGKLYVIKTDAFGNSNCNQGIPGNVINEATVTVANPPILGGSGLNPDTLSIVVTNLSSEYTLCFLNCSLSVSINQDTTILCHGDNTSATATPTGGTEPYTYSWSNGDTTATITNISAGSYTVTVYDSAGCSAVQAITITEPPALISSAQTLANISCSGAGDGSVAVTASGGTGPYIYTWIPSGCNTQTCTNQPASCYTVITFDYNACTSYAYTCVTEPAPLTANAQVVQNISCYGGNNGMATVGVSGGTGPYTYSWSPGSGSSATASFLAAGCYTVSVVDANGCTRSDTICITQPPQLTVTDTVLSNVTCHNGGNGIATVIASGGTGAYSYTWSPNGCNVATCSNLIAYCYYVTVQDANGCSAMDTVCITQPPNPFTWVPYANVNCYGDSSGIIQVFFNSGHPPYTYSWTPPVSNDSIASNLPVGTYSVTVTDSIGCSHSTSVTITQPTLLTATLTINDASCSTCNDGSAVVSPSGGLTPYTYSWSTTPVQMGYSATNLLPGIYTCCVTDANGCTTCVTDSVSFPNSVNDISGQGNSITITPNPFYNQLIIKSKSPCEIHLCDYTGKEILHQKINSAEAILNTENLAVGLYFLRVECGVGERNFKVVKQ